MILYLSFCLSCLCVCPSLSVSRVVIISVSQRSSEIIEPSNSDEANTEPLPTEHTLTFTHRTGAELLFCARGYRYKP